MTKPSRTDTAATECPPIRGPNVHKTIAGVRKDYLTNIIAFYLASGMTAVKAAKELSLSEERVRRLYATSAVQDVAGELAVYMKDYFAQRSEQFIAKIMDASEKEHTLLVTQTDINNEERVKIRDAVVSDKMSDSFGEYIYNVSTRLDAMKHLDSRRDATEKVGLSHKDEQAGVVFAVPMKDLAALIRQDTGKTIDVTPSSSTQEVQ